VTIFRQLDDFVLRAKYLVVVVHEGVLDEDVLLLPGGWVPHTGQVGFTPLPQYKGGALDAALHGQSHVNETVLTT